MLHNKGIEWDVRIGEKHYLLTFPSRHKRLTIPRANASAAIEDIFKARRRTR